MRLSALKVGAALVLVGCVWMGAIFAGGQKAAGHAQLERGASLEAMASLAGSDIGFYRIHMPEFAGDEVFVQILDPGGNVVGEDIIQTRMSVGYFDYGMGGEYAARATNVSQGMVAVELEFGETRSKEMAPAGVLVLVGSVTLVAATYHRIKNYSMAQPDENIS